MVGDTVLGIYTDGGGTLSYIATVPEPATTTLVALGAGLLLLRSRRKTRRFARGIFPAAVQ